MIEKMYPVTIRIDSTIHAAMKSAAKQKRVHISLIYEQAAEAYLTQENSSNLTKINMKNNVKKTNVLPVIRR